MDVPLRSESADAGIRSIFDEAVSLKEKDPEKCKELLRKAAGSGCSASMVLLGDILIDGTQEEKQEALSLFRKAYECGNGMGSRNLGYCFALGLGAGKDKEEAARWYLVSAESGNAKAQCNLGVLYEYGHGVPEDMAEAARWYKESGKNGYSRGMTNYARMLRDGKGVERDPQAALEWFEKSGSPRAKRLMALMLLEGNGVPEDRERAVKLLESAAPKDKKSAAILEELRNGRSCPQ